MTKIKPPTQLWQWAIIGIFLMISPCFFYIVLMIITFAMASWQYDL